MSIEEGSYVSAVFTHFDPNEALYDFNTIILKPKKKRFKTHQEALRYTLYEVKGFAPL